MRRMRMLAALAGATLLLAALASAASAGRLEISNTALRASFRELKFEGVFGQAICQITLEGTFHSRTTAKTVGTLVGYLTRASLGPCAVGAVTILSETLPWHAQYGGFTGTLPSIATIRTNVIGVSFRIRTSAGELCLARTTTTNPATGSFNREVGGALSTVAIGGVIPTGAECFGVSGRFTSDNGPVTVLNSTTRVTVRLI